MTNAGRDVMSREHFRRIVRQATAVNASPSSDLLKNNVIFIIVTTGTPHRKC